MCPARKGFGYGSVGPRRMHDSLENPSIGIMLRPSKAISEGDKLFVHHSVGEIESPASQDTVDR